MTPRAVAALGIGQCVNWGVLYYAFAVLVLPLQRELGVPTWTVTGAFSVALLVSAAAAPRVGRWADRGRGPRVMQVGGVAGAVLLVAWTFMPGVLALYLVWSALGLCMAATLYEPAFVIVGRAVEDPSRRLRTLAAVALLGGVASTAFLPGTSWLVHRFGWRGAVLVLAALLLLSTGFARVFVFRDLPPSSRTSSAIGPAAGVSGAGPASPPFAFIVAIFAVTSLASAGFTANLVPALGERGASPTCAATLGGLMGVMQLPGRAVLMNSARRRSPARLVCASLVLDAVGLAAVAVAPSMLVAAAGTMIFRARRRVADSGAPSSGPDDVHEPRRRPPERTPRQTAAGRPRRGSPDGRLAWRRRGLCRRVRHHRRRVGDSGRGVTAGAPDPPFIAVSRGDVTVRNETGSSDEPASIPEWQRLSPVERRGITRRHSPGVDMADTAHTPTTAEHTRRPHASANATQPSACCGGPARGGADACCARDAEAKSAGASGCGCAIGSGTCRDATGMLLTAVGHGVLGSTVGNWTSRPRSEPRPPKRLGPEARSQWGRGNPEGCELRSAEARIAESMSSPRPVM